MENYKILYPTYHDCKRFIAAMLYPSDKVSESALNVPLSEKISSKERILQYIWNERLLDFSSAKTISGISVQVINAGRWNDEMGPDFLDAEVKIGDKIIKGDIEIHIGSADWKRHRHNENNLYRNVVLHAFLKKTDDAIYDPLHDGSRIERVDLSGCVSPGMEIIEKALSGDEYLYRKPKGTGECHPVFNRLEPEFLEHFFTLAGKERINDKIKRFESQLCSENLDQVFYQSLMTAMGHKGTKALFFLLSKRVPIKELVDYSKDLSMQDRTDLIEALLLHTANLTPPPEYSSRDLDEEAQIYLNKINKWWAEFSVYFRDRIIPPTKRWFAGMRPANFPTRRIAGIARLISLNFKPNEKNSFLFQPFYSLIESQAHSPQTKKTINLFYKLLQSKITTADTQSYWAGRFSFKKSEKSKPQNLIGDSAAKIILFNALFPMAIIFARKNNDEKTENFIWHLAENYPALEENILIKFMKIRLFGYTPDLLPEDFFDREIRNQALYKIFYDACGNNEVTCEQCSFKSIKNINDIGVNSYEDKN